MDEPDHVQVVSEDFSFSLIADERPRTEHAPPRVPGAGRHGLRHFHAAALHRRLQDHAVPGERAVYHPGYYGASVPGPRPGRRRLVPDHDLCIIADVAARLSEGCRWRRS